MVKLAEGGYNKVFRLLMAPLLITIIILLNGLEIPFQNNVIFTESFIALRCGFTINREVCCAI